MPAIPHDFPRMGHAPVRVDALAWYEPGTPGLEAMHFEARGETVDLTTLSMSGLIGVPRSLAPDPTPERDFRSTGNHEFEASFTSTLRPEQVPFVDGVFRTLENELGCIGEAPTGFGKTVTGCWLTTAIGRTTCIVIPKGDLDWKPSLLEHTGIPAEKIDTWQGQKLPSPDAWVVVAMLQSIYREGVYPEEIYRRFGCVMFDEVHRLGAPEFSAAIRKFPAMWRFGLSATPDRRDGKMPLIHSHVGWRHVKGHSDAQKPDYYVVPTTWTEPLTKDGKVIPYEPSRTNHAKRSLMADWVRNASIAGAVLRAHRAGRRIIVFVEQMKHMERLHKALSGAGVPERMIVDYHGGIKAEDKARAKACPAGMVILATYKMTAEGTDIPALDTAVFAHPIYDPRQPAGRILRKHPGKPKPVILDVVDTESNTLNHIHKARWEMLRKLGAEWKGVFG